MKRHVHELYIPRKHAYRGEYNSQPFVFKNKMAASRFAQVSDEEISEMKINAVFSILQLWIILKQLFPSGEVNIGEYLPRLRLGKYSPIFTSPSANNSQIFFV